MSEDKDEARTNALKGRFDHTDREKGENGAEDDSSGEESRGSSSDRESSDGSERWVNMPLPPELAKDLDLTYRRMDLKAREDDSEIEKMRDFYPAVVRKGLENVDFESVLEEKVSEE